MTRRTSELVSRWLQAGLIDEPTAERIAAYERQHAPQSTMSMPIRLVLAFGALLLAAGVLLFVSAHWDALSPAQRFTLALVLVSGFHAIGAFSHERFPAMALALHAAGTSALGAGIFLAGQIFNLEEHWPGGIMLWSMGAVVASMILRQWPQMALSAVLVPAWLASEWVAALEPSQSAGTSVLAGGLLLLAISYFTATDIARRDVGAVVLFWIGGLALPPTAIFAAVSAAETMRSSEGNTPVWALTLGWLSALGLPALVWLYFRGAAARICVYPTAWVVVLMHLGRLGALPLYAWWALGATAFAMWGVHAARPERVNMGAAAFAGTVMAFYFSEVMDRLDRSASLLGLGVLFLAGGWVLERMRRRMVDHARSKPA